MFLGDLNQSFFIGSVEAWLKGLDKACVII